MAVISQNQSDYLNGLLKGGGGNAAWAQAQLQGSSVAPATPKADPAAAASYQAAANAYTAANWKNGTANGLTGDQNLANVYKGGMDPNKPVIPTQYIQGVLSRASADDAAAAQPDLKAKEVTGSLGGGITKDPIPATGNNGSGGGSMSSGNANLINQQYDQNYQSQLQKLQEARQIQQQGLNMQETGVNQNALQNLNNNDAMATRQLKQLQEVQANNGVRGGDSITATIGNQTAQQQGANQINQDKMNQLTDIQQKRSLINNNAAANDFSLMQQLQAARSGQLIDNNNTQDQRALQLAMLMGKDANGNNTLGGNQLALQQQGQGFNQNLQTQQFGLQKSAQDYNQNPNNPTNIGLGLNNQLTQLKLNDYPAQSKAAAQEVQQKLDAGEITKQEAQLKLDQLKDPNSVTNQKLKADVELTKSQSEYYKDHGQYYAGGGSKSGGSAASKTAANNTYTSTVYDQLSQLDPNDYAGYLDAAKSDIVNNIGQKAYDELKKSVLADQTAQGKADTTQGKADTALRSKAIAAAQNDKDWKYATTEERKAMIKEYEGYQQ